MTEPQDPPKNDPVPPDQEPTDVPDEEPDPDVVEPEEQ